MSHIHNGGGGGSSGSITIGVTQVTGGSGHDLLYDSSGIVVEATKTGNTSLFLTGFGTFTPGHGLIIDPNGNMTDLGGSPGMDIGNQVGASNINSVLFVDGSNNLAQDTASFSYTAITATLNVFALTTQATIADLSYNIDTPTSGSTITIPDQVYTEIIDPAGLLATLTVVTPATPTDGQIVRIKFTQGITALTISPNTGQSVKGNPTTIALGGLIDCQYRAANTTWYC